MKKILGYIRNIPLKHKIKYGVILSCALVIIVLSCIGSYYKNVLQDINVAGKWDPEGGYTQMSVYLPVGAMQDTMLFEGMLYQMEEALKKESIEPENSKSRMIVGAYSGYGSVTIQTEEGMATVDAIGVGGDFFYFHPLNMIDGELFSDEYLMRDYVVLEKGTAWKLFGALNVTGMTVEIGGVPFIVAGVYEPTEIPLAKEAGLEQSMVFMFYSSLEQYGTVSGVQWLDFILPNPVSGFGGKILTENSTVDLKRAVVMEQNTRFNVIPLYKLVPGYLERIMSKTGIVYPYWENMARGYENILVAFLLVETVCLVCGLVLVIITIRPVKNIKRGINWLVAKIKGRK